MAHIVQINELPAIMTVEEAAKLLRKGKNFVYQEVKEGRIPHVRLGKSVRILRDRLVDAMNSHAGA